MRFKTVLLFITGLIIYFGIFWLVGMEKLIYQIVRINFGFYAIGIACFFFTIILWTLRWRLFFKHRSKITFYNLFKVLLIGLAINNLTPVAKLGGEPIRIYILKKRYHIPTENGTATVLADLTIELITSSIFVIISMILITLLMNPPIWLSFVLIVFSFLTLVALLWVFGIYSNRSIVNKIILWFTKKFEKIKPFKKRIIEGYKEFQISFRRSLKERNILFKTIFLSFFMKFFDISKFFFIFLALGYHISLVQIIVALGIGIMLMSIPATPGNLGVFEGGMISAFVLIGISPEIAATVVFLERIVSFWLTTVLGSYIGILQGFNVAKKHKLKDIRIYP